LRAVVNFVFGFHFLSRRPFCDAISCGRLPFSAASSQAARKAGSPARLF